VTTLVDCQRRVKAKSGVSPGQRICAASFCHLDCGGSLIAASEIRNPEWQSARIRLGHRQILLAAGI
jgi:hypothetical protein